MTPIPISTNLPTLASVSVSSLCTVAPSNYGERAQHKGLNA